MDLIRPDIPLIIIFIIISPFTQIHLSNHIFGSTITLPVLGKWKPKTTIKKQTTGQAVIEHRTSSLPDKIWHQFSHGEGYPIVVNRLTWSDISSIITFIIFIIISLFSQVHSSHHIFGPTLTLPGKWKQNPKHKTNKQERTKTKQQARPWSNIGHPAYPTRYDINFYIVMVTRWLCTTSPDLIYPQL
jgi:hypothetical protein